VVEEERERERRTGRRKRRERERTPDWQRTGGFRVGRMRARRCVRVYTYIRVYAWIYRVSVSTCEEAPLHQHGIRISRGGQHRTPRRRRLAGVVQEKEHRHNYHTDTRARAHTRGDNER